MPVRRSRAYTPHAHARIRPRCDAPRCDARTGTQRNVTRTRVRMMKRCTPGQFDLRHFESEPTVRGRVLKRWDVGRVLRGPRHITSNRVRGPYDGRDRWLRVWKPPCEVRAIRDTRIHVRMYARARARAGVRRVYASTPGQKGPRSQENSLEEDSRLIPRNRHAKRDDDGGEFLQGYSALR